MVWSRRYLQTMVTVTEPRFHHTQRKYEPILCSRCYSKSYTIFFDSFQEQFQSLEPISINLRSQIYHICCIMKVVKYMFCSIHLINNKKFLN